MNYIYLELSALRKEPGPLAQSAVHLTAIQEIPSSHLGPAILLFVHIGREITLLLIQVGQLVVSYWQNNVHLTR